MRALTESCSYKLLWNRNRQKHVHTLFHRCVTTTANTHIQNRANTELNSVHSLCAEGKRIRSLFFYYGRRFSCIIRNALFTPSVKCIGREEEGKQNGWWNTLKFPLSLYFFVWIFVFIPYYYMEAQLRLCKRKCCYFIFNFFFFFLFSVELCLKTKASSD